MRKKRKTLKDLNDDELIEHWVLIHTQKQEFVRLNDRDGIDHQNVEIRLTEPVMKERGLFNVNVKSNQRS